MTGRSLEMLRLGVGLAHVVPGAEIQLATPRSGTLTASADPSSEITICDVREALLYSAWPHRPDVSRWIEISGIGGTLQSCKGGLYRIAGTEPEQRWFATLLRSDQVIALFRRLENEEPLCGAVNAKLLPDRPLGVTAVCVNTDDPRIDIDDVAVKLHSVCLVSELLGHPDTRLLEFSRTDSTKTPSPQNNPSPQNTKEKQK